MSVDIGQWSIFDVQRYANKRSVSLTEAFDDFNLVFLPPTTEYVNYAIFGDGFDIGLDKLLIPTPVPKNKNLHGSIKEIFSNGLSPAINDSPHKERLKTNLEYVMNHANLFSRVLMSSCKDRAISRNDRYGFL